MKILITGAEGFAGYYLIKLLLDKGVLPADIYGIYLENTGRAGKEFKINWIQCNIKEVEFLDILNRIKPDQIYHLAGQSSVGLSYKIPEDTIKTNVIGTLYLFNWLRDNKQINSRTLIISSGDIYIDTRKKVRTEDTRIEPSNFYSLSKFCVDYLYGFYFMNFNLDIVCVRPFNHTGPGQSTRFALPSFAEQISRIKIEEKNGKIFTGNLNIWRDFTDVRDVVKGYYLLMENGKSGEVYNVCRGESFSLEELLRYMIEISGKEIQVCVDKKRLRKQDIEYIIGDYSKLHMLTEWEPEIDIKTTLKDMLDYFGGNSV